MSDRSQLRSETETAGPGGCVPLGPATFLFDCIKEWWQVRYRDVCRKYLDICKVEFTDGNFLYIGKFGSGSCPPRS